PMAEIGAICQKRGVVFHVDAVQAAGKVPIDVQAWQATMATITGHKYYGPKGAGALYIKRGFKPVPLQHGGDHEKGRRAGTENVPAIVGLGRHRSSRSGSSTKALRGSRASGTASRPRSCAECPT